METCNEYVPFHYHNLMQDTSIFLDNKQNFMKLH